ncbi:MAG: hypothetical protein K1W24_14420 [Lachnospiraceae bacterium]
MAQKLKLKDIGMDSVEILYYERQAVRKKAYISRKRKKDTTKNRISQMEQASDTFDITLQKAI